MGSGPTLVYVYGPPAVGKLTVATELQRLSGFRLFHNHLTIDALRDVLGFGSDAFNAVLKRLRLDVFQTAAEHGIDVIFTNNSVWNVPDGREQFASFATDARKRVESAGGRTLFVQLLAPVEVLEERVESASRAANGKLLDPKRLSVIPERYDPRPLHTTDLTVDTSVTPPGVAAEAVLAALP